VSSDLLQRALAVPEPGRYKLELVGREAQEQPGVDIPDRESLFGR
jgi:hypothetical protein